MNYKTILSTLGGVLKIEAGCMILPLICSLIYNDGQALVFLSCILLCLLSGICLNLFRPKNKNLYAKEGFIIVALSWILISIYGALPFIFSGYIKSFPDALFETVSGFTTTGASILADVEALPKSLLFWRSFTHWIGGMGVLVFLVALFPASGGSNLHIIKAESPGPQVSKIVPKIRQMAKILYGLYILFTVMEIVFLLAGGMSVFDALTTAFGTAGTGGFGIKNSSIAEYSPYIQIVVTIFMILFGVDFSVYYLFATRKFKSAVRSEEVRIYFGIILLSIIIIAFNTRGLFSTVSETIRHSAFQVGSIITTTGFATTDFDKWPELSKFILVTLMFIGACAGSTGGGIKVSRILILFKSLLKEIKIAPHPRVTHKLSMNDRPIAHETIRAVNTFLVAYIFIYFASVMLISIDNFDFTTNFTAVAATLNNIGPGLSGVGPTQNFSAYSDFSKFVFIFDMLVVRLEIFPVLVLFSRYTWK